MKKKLLWLAVLPLAFTLSCGGDNKPESSDNEALTETDPMGDESKRDPNARPQEYEHSTADERMDTIPPKQYNGGNQ